MEEGINKITNEFNLKDLIPIVSKTSRKHLEQHETNSLIVEEIDNESEHKSKVKCWRERKRNLKFGIRPNYMEKLTTKCNAIIKSTASMLPVRTNYKKQQQMSQM